MSPVKSLQAHCSLSLHVAEEGSQITLEEAFFFFLPLACMPWWSDFLPGVAWAWEQQVAEKGSGYLAGKLEICNLSPAALHLTSHQGCFTLSNYCSIWYAVEKGWFPFCLLSCFFFVFFLHNSCEFLWSLKLPLSPFNVNEHLEICSCNRRRSKGCVRKILKWEFLLECRYCSVQMHKVWLWGASLLFNPKFVTHPASTSRLSPAGKLASHACLLNCIHATTLSISI